MGLPGIKANQLPGEQIVPGAELDFEALQDDYHRVERAILFLERNVKRQPELKEIAESVHLSEFHFQRLFTRWVGISPKRFLQYLTKEGAKRLLDRSENLLSTAYEVGLSGPGRLHDLFITCEAVTPGEFKSRGEGVDIHYGFHATPFGECLLGVTPRGICHLAFVEQDRRAEALEDLRRNWKKAALFEDPAVPRPFIGRIFSPGGDPSLRSTGDPSRRGPRAAPAGSTGWNQSLGSLDLLPVYLNGTNFQIKVWEALLRIPPGSATTYQDIAIAIGMPGAARAVGNAVGHNPVPVLIPCHRVIRKMGDYGNYRYGSARKKALLGWEQARSEA